MASWSDDATFYFLALVQQFPTLWDSSRDDFLMCPKKEHLWHSICKQMSSEHPAHGPYSVEGLKNVFANKRRTYRKEKKKIDERKSGQARDDSYVVKWKFFRCLKFLDAVPRPGHRYATEAFEEEAVVVQKGESEKRGGEFHSDCHEPEEYLFETSSPTRRCTPDAAGAENHRELSQLGTPASSASAPVPENSGHSALTPPSKRMRQWRSSSTANSILNKRQTALDTLVNAVQRPLAADDAAAHFGNYAAALMRRMNPARQIKCQKEIVDVIEKHLDMIE
ncbi:uncharacterized protein LOC144103289 [Amblyomma americanum]